MNAKTLRMDSGDRENIGSISPFSRELGLWKMMLREANPLTGEISGSRVLIEMENDGAGVSVLAGDMMCRVSQRTIRNKDREILRRDSLGWEKIVDLSDAERETCALILAAGIPEIA